MPALCWYATLVVGAGLDSGIGLQGISMRRFMLAIALLAHGALCFAQNDDGASTEAKTLLGKVRAGDTATQFGAGTADDAGDGARRSGSDALERHEIAANNGHAEAQNSTGSALQAEAREAETLVWYGRASKPAWLREAKSTNAHRTLFHG